MSNANILAFLAGIGVGVILYGAAVIFRSTTSSTHSHNENRRRGHVNKPIRCFVCKEIKPSQLYSLLCGDTVHQSCLYEKLISCKVTDIWKYSCGICRSTIDRSIISVTLISRCGACHKEFVSGSFYTLGCGHRLHKSCLSANKELQSSKDNRAMYRCPYKLLECPYEVKFDDIPAFNVQRHLGN